MHVEWIEYPFLGELVKGTIRIDGNKARSCLVHLHIMLSVAAVCNW